MTAIPHISKDDFLGLPRRRFPDAEIQAEDINPEYGSWRIEARRGDAVAHISWGPLTGFGGTDFGHLSDDPDLFKPFDVGFTSVEEADEFVTRVLDADAQCRAAIGPGRGAGISLGDDVPSATLS